MATVTPFRRLAGVKWIDDVIAAREQKGTAPDEHEQRVAAIRATCPEVVCICCYGDGCSVCRYEGLTCPTCKDAHWIGVIHPDPTRPSTLRPCPTCLHTIDGETAVSLPMRYDAIARAMEHAQQHGGNHDRDGNAE